MSDGELAEYLGIAHYTPDQIARVLAAITPQRRAVIERILRYARELRAWKAGQAPMPLPPTADGARLSRERLRARR